MRIQREMQEWNSTKAENEEFWKAPKFALCSLASENLLNFIELRLSFIQSESN